MSEQTITDKFLAEKEQSKCATLHFLLLEVMKIMQITEPAGE